jgi:Uma2 family endonuclease
MATVPPIDVDESRPRVDHLVTEDETPVDNILSEKQQRLLTEPLYSSWDSGRPFVAMANVGLFYAVRQPPLVPDVLLSLDVETPPELMAKEHRSYFLWEYGKAPDAVVEIVSNTEGGETTVKMLKYARIGILYYAIYDPEGAVQPEPLRVFVLRDQSYTPCPSEWLPVLGLGLTFWHGRFENCEGEWLRWCDRQCRVIPTGAERAEQERERAEQERAHAQQEQARAEQERARAERERARAEQERDRADRAGLQAERLAARLRELGINPNGE